MGNSSSSNYNVSASSQSKKEDKELPVPKGSPTVIVSNADSQQEEVENMDSNMSPETDATNIDIVATPLRKTDAGNESFEISFSATPSKKCPLKEPISASKGLSKDALDEKMRLAAERRLSIEASKKEKAAVNVAEANARRESLDKQYRTTTEQHLTEKLAVMERNRGSQLEKIKEKVGTEDRKLEEAHQKVDAEVAKRSKEVETELEQRMACRLVHLQDRKLEEAHQKVDAEVAKRSKEVETELEQRMAGAKELREKQLGEKVEKVMEHNEKVRKVMETPREHRQEGEGDVGIENAPMECE